MVISRLNSLRTEVLGQGLAPATALDKDQALAASFAYLSCLLTEKIRLLIGLPKTAHTPTQRNRSPLRSELHSIKPIGDLSPVTKGRRKTQDSNEGIQTSQAGDSSLQPGSTSRVSEKVQLVDDDQVDLRDPGPVTAPVASAYIESLRRHDQKIRLVVRDGDRSPLRTIVTGKDANLEAIELLAPLGHKFFSQGPQGRKVDHFVTRLQSAADSQCGEPGLSTTGGHLQHAAKARVQKSVVHDFLLNGVQQEVLHTQIGIDKKVIKSNKKN
jgi:hypothetical protein